MPSRRCTISIFLVAGALLWRGRCGALQPGPPSASAGPRVFVYPLPDEMKFDGGNMARQMEKAIRESAYHTDDGDAADFYLIPGSGHYPTQDKLLAVFDHVRQSYPWWNRTREAGETRHLIFFLSDDGPGSAAFQRPIFMGNGVPDDVNPSNLNRTIMFLIWNGLRDITSPGKDIMIPTAENVCGPLCGYNLTTLRAKSIWALGEADLQAELTRKRPYRLFYGGMIKDTKPDDFTGRGGIYHHYHQRPGFRVVRHGEDPRVSFADAMRDADFCYSPMGQNGGDTDRYVAAIMFGCIPVMLNSSHWRMALPHALPLEEVLHWERFGTIINAWDLESLDDQLRCLEPYVPMMRMAMRDVWQHMLYSTTYNKSYLGESRQHDVMHTIMQILAHRKAHGFKASKAAMERMAHHPRRFPCTNRPARLHVPALHAVEPAAGLAPHDAEAAAAEQLYHQSSQHLERHARLATARRLMQQWADVVPQSWR